MAPSAQNDPQIQRSDSALFIKKKMGVTPLPGNQAGKGMMALLGALGKARVRKMTIKGVVGDPANLSEPDSSGFHCRIWT